MKRNPSKTGLLLAAALILAYLAGYGVIRKDFHSPILGVFVAPSYVRTNAALRGIYFPCFWLDARMTGERIVTSPPEPGIS